MPKITIVTNIPAPYRIPVYQRLAEKYGYECFHAIYCSEKEDNRDWILSKQGFAYTTLKKNYIHLMGRYIHANKDIWTLLQQLNPDVVITTGFNPSHLLAFFYCVYHNKIHIPQTDGTVESEQKLSFIHNWARRLVYRYSKAFIGASQSSLKLYGSYGLNQNLMFLSHLCANNTAYTPTSYNGRQFDFMFSGRFTSEKNPLFALDVAAGVAKALNRKISILMLGSGPLLEQTQAHAATLSPHVEAVFPGFLQQADLPDAYRSAKVFLFPSSLDTWGVVANEACAAGQAVLVSPHAGVANELVCHGENGFVLALELPLWIEKAASLINDQHLLKAYAERSQSIVQAYSYDAAAQGIIAAISTATAGAKN